MRETANADACNRPGPMVKTSPQFLAQMICNRVHGHDGPHRRYDPRTFRVVAEWDTIYEPADPPKKKIQPDPLPKRTKAKR